MRDKQGDITLYCKGADSTVYERLSSDCEEMRVETTRHLEVHSMHTQYFVCCGTVLFKTL